MNPPIQSGNAVIDGLFSLCVQLLLWLANLFGVSYTINIWIFCVIWSLVTVALVAAVVWQRVMIRRLAEKDDR